MENRTLNYKGVDIHYTTAGSSTSSDAIVFLHPAFAAKEVFAAQLQHFAKNYLQIAIDMIGHGDSRQDKPQLNMKDMPDIIKAIMDKEQTASAHLMGVSLGSLMVQGFADKYPAYTKTVTVVGGYSIHKDNKHILKAQSKEMGKWLFYFIFSIKKLRKTVVQQSVYTEDGQRVFAKCAEKITRKSFLAMNGMSDIFKDKKDKVAYPMLLVCGEHDIDLARDAAERLSLLEECEYVKIEDAGHCANLDNPNKFNKVVEEFIQKHEA